MTATDDARRVIEEHPDLHYQGWGQPPSPGDQRDIVRERARLLTDDSLAVIVEVVKWCRKLPAAEVGLNGHTSYGLKHMAEREISGVHYVSNGQLIAAMLTAGYTFARGSQAGFSPTFRRPKEDGTP